MRPLVAMYDPDPADNAGCAELVEFSTVACTSRKSKKLKKKEFLVYNWRFWKKVSHSVSIIYGHTPGSPLQG